MKPIDIVPADLEIVRQILQDFVPEIEVRAFGSRVTWSARETSDLDLALMTDDRLSDSCSMDLREAFSESELPFKVDLIDWATTSDNFRKVIEREYVVVQIGATKREETKGWQNLPFSEAVLINPKVHLERGEIYPFVDMASVSAGSQWVSSMEMREYSGGGSKFESGDTLMARITPCLENGKISQYKSTDTLESAHGSTEFIVIRGRLNVTDTKFAYYLTRSEKVRSYAIGQMTGTSGRQRVPTSSLDNLTVSIPSLPEQRTIAHILGTLDDKIELNRQTNETLEAIARALFKSWFVDFDPVRAKMEGRQPAGISPELAALFPDSFEDSELGEIPKGWSIAPIGDLVRVIGGATPSTKEPKFWKGGEYCWATPKDLSGVAEPVLVDTNKHITDEGIAKISSGLLPPGTVLLSSRAPIGYLAITQVPTAVNQGFIAMVCDGELPNLYILYWCEQSMPSILAKSGGTTFDEITKKNFRPMPVTIPSTDVLDAYTKQIDTIHKRIVSNVHESSNLAAHRDNLLPKLVSGEICW